MLLFRVPLQAQEGVSRWAQLINTRHTRFYNSIRGGVELIKNHKGFRKFPVFGYLEDYSQDVPRGHHNISEEFKSYLKTMI